MASRKKSVHIDNMIAGLLWVYSDLSHFDIVTIKGVMKTKQYHPSGGESSRDSLVFVHCDPRYDQQEIIDEITALAEARAEQETESLRSRVEALRVKVEDFCVENRITVTALHALTEEVRVMHNQIIDAEQKGEIE